MPRVKSKYNLTEGIDPNLGGLDDSPLEFVRFPIGAE